MNNRQGNELGILFWACVLCVAWLTGSLAGLLLGAILGYIAYRLFKAEGERTNAGYFGQAIGLKRAQYARLPRDAKEGARGARLLTEIAALEKEQEHADRQARLAAGIAGVGVCAAPLVGVIAAGAGYAHVRKQGDRVDQQQIAALKQMESNAVHKEQKDPESAIDDVDDNEEPVDI
jgi:hypothetical protein